MSQVQKKRLRIVRQISKRQKEHYFSKKREEMRLQYKYVDQQSTLEPSQFRMLMKRSLLKNGLLPDIRQNNLIESLIQAVSIEISIVDVTNLVAVCGNILIDDLELEEKQQMARLILKIFQNRSIVEEIDGVDADLNLTQSILHCFVPFVKTLHFIQEDLAIASEQIILSISFQITLVLISLTKNCLQSEQVQNRLQKISLLIIETLHNYLYSQSQYANQIDYKLGRNIGLFVQILQAHQTIERQQRYAQILHEGLMSVYEILSQKAKMLEYPFFFQNKAFFSLPLRDILQAHSDQGTRVGLKIIINLLTDYSGSLDALIYNICLQLSPQRIEQTLKKLLLIDKNQNLKMELMVIILKEQRILQLFGNAVEQLWKEIVDMCINLLKSDADVQLQTMVLRCLMLLSQIQDVGCSFVVYVQNIGGESLLQYIREQAYEFSSQQQAENIDSYSTYLLDLIKSTN